MNLLLKLLRAPASLAALVGDRWLWPPLLRLQGVTYGDGLKLVGAPVVRMKPGGSIRLGKRVSLYSRWSSNPLLLHTPCALQLLAPDARITIGDGSALSGVVICAAESVDIGAHVLVGANCKIVDTDFHPLSPDARRIDRNRGAVSKPVVIHDDVFIGAGAVILKGTVLGAGCIVGAGAVVTREFPAGSVIAGNPATIIKTPKVEENVS